MMDVTGRPVPLPRKTGKKYTCESSEESSFNSNSSSSNIDDNQYSRKVPIIPDANCNVPSPKPVPLPRKLVKRLSKRDEEKNEIDDEFLLPLTSPGKGINKFCDEQKRMTLNIFKRKIDNPFVDFEESLKDATTLKTIPSPLDVPQDAWTRFSTECYESEECSGFDTIEQSHDCTEDRHLSSSSMPVQSVTEPVQQRLKKNLSCPGATETTSSPRNSSSTDTSESIYEAISTYSSEPKLSELIVSNPSLSAQEMTSCGSSCSSTRSNGMSSSNSSGEYPASATTAGVDIVRFETPQTVSSETMNITSSSSTIYSNINEIERPSSVSQSFIFQSKEQEGPPIIHRRSAASRIATKSMEIQKKQNVYDEVAVEDGNVVMSNRTSRVTPSSEESTNNSTSNNSCSSLTSRNSIVVEFDPLLRPNSTSNNEDESEIDAHCLGFRDHEFPSIGAVPQDNLLPQETFTDCQNFDAALKSTTSFQTPPEPTRTSTSDNDGYLQLIQRDTKPPNSNELPRPSSYVLPSSNDKSSSSASPSHSPPPANAALKKVADSSQINIFRRLSSRMRPIKEESSVNNRGNDVILSTLTVSICPKCYDEHPENAKCKFSPTPRENIVYASALSKPAGITKRDFVKRWTTLSKGKLTFYRQRGESKTIDNISLEKVVMISKKDDHRVSPNQNELKCFQMTLGNGKSSTAMVLAGSESERSSWMQKYIEVFTSSFPTNVISSYDRGGWCFIKEGVTGDWHPSWFILSGRKLFYAFHNSSDDYFQVDLRKVREISLSPKEGDHKCSFVDNNEVLTIDAITKILFIQTENVKFTSTWEKSIRSAALYNGVTFDEMQLTIDNVPVIVDKCIAFLYAHGILSEGIYRQSGANSRIAGLLEDFKKDAWAVSLSAEEFSAHDVAGALKRFFRTLPEPLFTDKLYPRWISTFGIVKQNIKLQEYRKLLDELPHINYNIIKELMRHLYAVHELHEKNLMPLDNLAPIWGPTLMNVDIPKSDATELTDASKLAQSYETALAECGVIRELIENYSNYTLFQVDDQQISREKNMQLALEKIHLSKFRRKPSGDLRIYVHIYERDENSAISITIAPNSTAASIVEQIAKMTGQVYDQLSLHEVIDSKSMERPLFASEKITETLYRWSMWDAEECKSNYLILKRNTLYPALIPYAKDPTLTYGDFKYADSKSKTFRKYAFEFSSAKLKYFKDSKATIELESWNIEDIVWYIGADKKRKDTPSRFNFTFIPRIYKFKRSKEEPYFGNVVSCNTEEELHKFIAAMIIGEHPEGLYPSIIL